MRFGLGRTKLIGTQAKGFCSTPGFHGRVLAVVSDAVYLQANPRSSPSSSLTGEEEILWLAQNNVPMHSRALRGVFNLSALRVGTMFQSDGACVQFDGGNHPLTSLRADSRWPLRFADARVWQPATIDPVHVAPRQTVMARVREFDLTGFPKPVRSLQDTRALIGLGEGLTPAGDDFVGGLLFALYHLRVAYPGVFRWEQPAIDDLLDYARPRTNIISYALLRDHAHGQGVELLHDWIVALLCSASPREIEMHMRRVREIGHTTGSAMLAGALAAMDLAE